MEQNERYERYEEARCLFCETGKEKRVVHAIGENGWGRAIFARRIRYIKKNGDWEKVEFPLLPGYVFVYTERDERQAREYQKIPHVIRALRYENGQEALTGDDLKFADWLWRMNGEIGVIQTVRVGDRIEVADGTFRELHGTIEHVNRRQRKVYVVLDTQSISMHTWLAYEQVERMDGGKGE